MSKTAPAPDYKAAAEQQGQSSKEVTNMQTWANRPTINTPFGSQTWDASAQIDPATGQKVTSWTQNNTLDPVTQKALEAQQNIQAGKSSLAESKLGQMQNEFSGSPDWNSFLQLRGAPDASNFHGIDTSGNTQVDPSNRYYDKAGDAVMSQFNRRMQPQFANQDDELRTKLYNQGLKEGDAAYDKAWNSQQLQHNDARQQAMDEATKMSGSEAQRMFGMDLSGNQNQYNQELGKANLDNGNMSMAFGQGVQGAQMQNTARQQQIAEMMAKRGFSLNEMNAILNGQQVNMPTMPSFNQATKSDTVQYSDAAKNQYSAAQDAANAQNAMVGQIAGGASMFMSDRRLKSNIVKIGKWRGHNLYVYDIFGRTQVGVMSDEVSHIPGAVSKLHGYDVVNYNGL
jgi:hypothetical protein